jgi:hypothetical protein
MAITRTIEIDGRPVPFKASAAIPRIYRLKFGRDIFADIDRLMAAMDKQSPEGSDLDLITLGIFEDVAYTMAKYADPEVPETPEEWLDGFSVFSIYFILPQIIELWGLNNKTEVQGKKKAGRQTAQ